MVPQFTPVADRALLVTLADQVNEEVHNAIVAFDRAVTLAHPRGVIESVPALVNVLVSFDPVLTDHIELEAALREILDSTVQQNTQHSRHTVLVCYEDPFALDLDAVAAACNLSSEAVINAHLAQDYKVLMYGFAPGYAYMAGVDDSIQVPRKPAAVRDRPAGSVMIAGPQCLVTTLKMPTGWSIIGRSPTQILLDDPDQPFLFSVGDEVAFERIDRAVYEEMSGAVSDD